MWYRSLVVFAVLFLLSFTYAAARATVLPGGFSYDDSDLSQIVFGIDPALDQGGCCWMARNAAFIALQPPGANRLRIAVFAPSYAIERGVMERVRARVDGHVADLCCVRVGETELTLALPESTRWRRLRVNLYFPHAFRPVDVGVSPDERHLTVLLLGVRFENARTGEILAGSLQPAPTDLKIQGAASLFVVVFGALVTLLAALRRLRYAVVALVASMPFSFAVPFHGTTITLPKAVLLATLLAVVARRPYRFQGVGVGLKSLLGALLGVGLSMLLSDVHAVVMHAAFRETLKVGEYLCILAVAYLAFRQDSDEALVIRVLCAVTLVVVALAAIQMMLGTTQGITLAGHLVERLAGPLEGPNQLGAYLGIAGCVSYAAWLRGMDRRLTGTTVLIAAIATLATFSRGGILGFAIAVIIVTIAYRRPDRKVVTLWIIAALTACVVGLSIAIGSGDFAFARTLFGGMHDVRGGIGTRTLLWHAALGIWRAHPWIGVGPGNFELRLYVLEGVRTHANSVYLNTLAEQGIVGVFFLLTLLVASVVSFVRARTVLGIAALGASAALALHQSIDTLWIYPKIGALWFALLGIALASLDARVEEQQIVDLSPDLVQEDRSIVPAM